MARADVTTTQIEIVEVEPRLAALVRKRVGFADIPQAQREARVALAAALKAANVEPIGPSLTVWRPPQDGIIDYAPGVFVPDGLYETNDISLFTLPQGRAAHLRMHGPYEGLPDAWARLFGGCGAERLAGLNWEIYVPDTSPEKNRTDLFALLA
jgi:effector-binding domain-containing protein